MLLEVFVDLVAPIFGGKKTRNPGLQPGYI